MCCKPVRGAEVVDIRNWCPGLSHDRDMCSKVKGEPHITGRSENMKVLVTRSCPTLCDPMDCSPPGSCDHGESPDKNRSENVKVLVTRSCLTLCNPMDCSLPGSCDHWDSPDKNTCLESGLLFHCLRDLPVPGIESTWAP